MTWHWLARLVSKRVRDLDGLVNTYREQLDYEKDRVRHFEKELSKNMNREFELTHKIATLNMDKFRNKSAIPDVCVTYATNLGKSEHGIPENKEKQKKGDLVWREDVDAQSLYIPHFYYKGAQEKDKTKQDKGDLIWREDVIKAIKEKVGMHSQPMYIYTVIYGENGINEIINSIPAAESHDVFINMVDKTHKNPFRIEKKITCHDAQETDKNKEKLLNGETINIGCVPPGTILTQENINKMVKDTLGADDTEVAGSVFETFVEHGAGETASGLSMLYRDAVLRYAVKRNKELKKELELDNELLKEFNKFLDVIPACKEHGSQCVPHALEWVEKAKERLGRVDEAVKKYTDAQETKTTKKSQKEKSNVSNRS